MLGEPIKRDQAEHTSSAAALRTLGDLHLHVGALLRDVFTRACAGEGLTFTEGRALRLIAGQASQRDLIDVLAADPSRVSAVVRRLEALGLVTRSTATGDRRHRLVVLTPAGDVSLDRIAAYLDDHSPFEQALTDDECVRLGELLTKMAEFAEIDTATNRASR